MPCRRLGCDSILCNRLSDRFGYNELVELGCYTDPYNFLNTEKTIKIASPDSFKVWDREFPLT